MIGLAPRLGAVGRQARRAARRRRRGVRARGARPRRRDDAAADRGDRLRRRGGLALPPRHHRLGGGVGPRVGRRACSRSSIPTAPSIATRSPPTATRARRSRRKAAAGAIHAFVELHVEQGGVLEAAELPIGAVTAIAGLVQRTVSFLGDANHAGATPMNLRRDALLAAAEWALGIERGRARSRRRRRRHRRQADGRAGRQEHHPRARRRHLRPARADARRCSTALDAFVVSSLHGIGDKRGVEIEQQLLQRVEPGPMHEPAIAAVERGARGRRAALAAHAVGRHPRRAAHGGDRAVVDDLRAVDRRQVALPDRGDRSAPPRAGRARRSRTRSPSSPTISSRSASRRVRKSGMCQRARRGHIERV